MNTQTLLTDLTSEQEELVSGGGRWTRFRNKYLRPALKEAGKAVVAYFFGF